MDEVDLPAEAGEAGGKDRQFVTALARGLEVLRAFHKGDTALGNQEIAARTGLPKPTVSRLTYTLTKLGYLTYLERFGKYRLSPVVLSLGYTALAGMDIREVARPLMQAMADETNAAVSLGSRDRDSMVYIESCRGTGPLMMRLGIGSRIPLATTAMGRAYLAAIPESERRQAMDSLAASCGEDWPKVKAGIEAAVADYARRGFAMSVGEWQAEVNSVGVALVVPDSGMVISLNCGGAAFFMPRDKLEGVYGPRLVRLVRDIEAALGEGA